MKNPQLFFKLLNEIQCAGKQEILARVHQLGYEDSEEKSEQSQMIDLLFVHAHRHFPNTDAAIAEMFADWMQRVFPEICKEEHQ